METVLKAERSSARKRVRSKVRLLNSTSIGCSRSSSVFLSQMQPEIKIHGVAKSVGLIENVFPPYSVSFTKPRALTFER